MKQPQSRTPQAHLSPARIILEHSRMRREMNAQRSGRGIFQPSRVIFRQAGTLQKLSITSQEKRITQGPWLPTV